MTQSKKDIAVSVNHVDLLALAASLPLDCPCNGPQPCREGQLGATRCPNAHCGDSGVVPFQINERGDAEAQQCEFCYCEPSSWFNVQEKLRAVLKGSDEKGK